MSLPAAATEPLPAGERCAAHPGRPALDRCPVCGRPRCGADQVVGDEEAGCLLCRANRASAAAVRRRVPLFEGLVRAALGAFAAAVLASYVTAQYVEADLFQYLAPGVLGVVVGGTALAAAGSPGRGLLAQRIRVVAVLYALLGTALGFVIEGTYAALSVHPDVLVPYAVTAVAAWYWTTPPKPRRKQA